MKVYKTWIMTISNFCNGMSSFLHQEVLGSNPVVAQILSFFNMARSLYFWSEVTIGTINYNLPHYTLINSQPRLNRHMYKYIIIARFRRKMARKNSVVLRWDRTRDLALHVDWCERLFRLAFFRLMMSSALVKLLSGRTPWSGRHFCGWDLNPAHSREHPSKQHRPHC